MAGRKVKCFWCNITDTPKEEMEFEYIGTSQKAKRHYHKDCYQEFLKDKEFKRKEVLEKDDLVKVIQDIYKVNELPTQAFIFLEKLRNGENIFGAKQNIGKRYKQGYKYNLIKATYEYCRDTIEYWNGVKDFNGFMGAFRYGLSIIIDKIYIVEQREKEREKREIDVKNHIENVVADDSAEFVTNYEKPKKKDKGDFLDFLDD